VVALLVRVSVPEAVCPAWLLSNMPVLRLQLAAEDKTEDSTRTEYSTVSGLLYSLYWQAILLGAGDAPMDLV
jgi:hypothetical protein